MDCKIFDKWFLNGGRRSALHLSEKEVEALKGIMEYPNEENNLQVDCAKYALKSISEMLREEDMENRSFLLWSEKRRHYSSCLADLDNFIQSHSISFSGSKFLSMKDMENLHRMFAAIQEGLDIFVRYAEHCDLRVNFDGKTCTLMEPK